MRQLRNNCILCNNEYPSLLCIEDDVKVFRCSNCGLVYSGEIPETIFDRKETPETIYDDTQKLRNQIYHEIYNIIKRYKTTGFLCDVGCRAGNFLDVVKQSYDVYGVEVSDKLAQYCRDRGLNVYAGTLQECNLNNDALDIITYLSVFEHLKNPDKELKQIDKNLKPNGILVLEIPNLRFWRMKIQLFKLINKSPGLMPLIHLFYYDQKVIERFLDKHGFEILFIKPSFSCEGQSSALLSFLYKFIASISTKLPVGQIICNNLVIIACKDGTKNV